MKQLIRYLLGCLLGCVMVLSADAVLAQWDGALVRVSPQPNATGIASNTLIQIVFASAVDNSSLNDSTVVVFASQSGYHHGLIQYDSFRKTAIFNPNADFFPGEQVTVVLTPKIRTVGASNSDSNFVWSFTIAATGGSGKFSKDADYATTYGVQSIYGGDLDQDGDIDLACVQVMSYDNFVIFLNDGNGILSETQRLTVGTTPRSLCGADFDQDGDLDIATANTDSYNISVLLNNGQGEFLLDNTYSSDEHPFFIAANDFNGDGKIDLATANRETNSFSILLNTGNGRFTFHNTYGVGEGPRTLTCGDFDLDGSMDIATADLESNQISVFLNNGDGSFRFQNTYGSGSAQSNPHYLVAGDVNNDRAPDLIVTCRGVDSLLVLLNQGNGSFAKNSLYATGREPRSIYVSDLDNDNDMDMATANFLSTTVMVFKNNQGSNFSLDSFYVTDSSPRYVFGGDMDSDGDIDLAVANYDAKNITILKNQNTVIVNSPPESPVLVSPLSGAFVADPAPSLSWQIPPDQDDDLLHFQVGIYGNDTWIYNSSFDTAGFKPPPPVRQGSGIMTYTPITELADGQYQWDVVAFDPDAAGNLSLKWRFIVDATPPHIDSLVAQSPTFRPNWYNPTNSSKIGLHINYDELHMSRMILDAEFADDQIIVKDLPGGSDQVVAYNFDVSNVDDGTYSISVTLQDSAGNLADESLNIGLDSTTPENASVFAISDTSTLTLFTVSWNQSTDTGAGVAGYDARIKIDNGNWVDWIMDTKDTATTYQGSHGHKYSFEVRAKDNVGNAEPFLGIAEATVSVDTTAQDQDAPAAPIQLTAGGSNPSPWQSENAFQIRWTNPMDPSGIKRCLYKFNTAPAATNDTSGTASGVAPVTIHANREDGERLYLWLEDNLGNVDFHNFATTVLRYDATAPIIDTILVADPDFAPNWFNQNSTHTITSVISYSELHAATVLLDANGLAEPATRTDIPSGLDQELQFQTNIQTAADGAYTLAAIIADSAGNKSSNISTVRLDHTPPSGTIASSPDTAATVRFTIDWKGSGSDGEGVGLSGKYNVRFKLNNGEWSNWLTDYQGTSAQFTGTHGNMYAFEAAATDQLENQEAFTGNAETVTVVDTLYKDTAAPVAPQNVLVNGANPGNWQKSANFEISWSNPPDPSGITRCRYKLNSVPSSDSDTTGTAPANLPLEITATKQDGQYLFLWLEDGRGNTNFQNFAHVILRWDATPPVITEISALSPAYETNWFNQDSTEIINISLQFSESRAASATLMATGLGDPITLNQIASGANKTIQFPLAVTQAADGPYALQATLRDSAGNEAISSELIINLDATPPAISIQSMNDVVVGQGITITAVIKDENRVVESLLSYREGGQRTFLSTDLVALDDTTFFAIIPGEIVTERGVDYFLSASDGLSRAYAPVLPPGYIPVKIDDENHQGIANDSPQPFGSDQKAFRMISFPLVMDDPSPHAVLEDDLGPYDRKKWRLFYFNSQANSYNEFPSTGDFKPGKAFWLIVKDSNQTIDSGPGMSVPTNRTFTIPLFKGWNDIGNPFNFAVDWSSVSLSSGNMSDISGPYTYENGWLLPTEISQLEPGEGYSIYTDQDDLVVAVEPVEASPGASKPLEKDSAGLLWHLTLAASCQQARDNFNRIGCAVDAKIDWDNRDYVEPPPMGSYVSIYFPHPEWTKFPGRFATDIRPDIGTGAVWQFQVESNIENADVTLAIDNIAVFLPEYDIMLSDLTGMVKMDARKSSHYSFPTGVGKTTRLFKLVIGTPAYIDETDDDLPMLPTRSELSQNYPNPFNMQTRISYQIAKTGLVKLTIYNIRGQRIKTLLNEVQQPGYYHAVWDGLDINNQNAGSGIYLCTIEAGDYVMTRKMILVK
ncbi:VCBS repeat-containing protein [candidate division KSB1 bacterium]|nr:VCBS repeat-containing protein [candidate division KSB1 bacterium]